MTKTPKDTMYMTAAIERIQPTNRGTAITYLKERGKEGLGSSSLYNYALALRKLDTALHGQPYEVVKVLMAQWQGPEARAVRSRVAAAC